MGNGKERCAACSTADMPCNTHEFEKRMNKFVYFRLISIAILNILKDLQGMQRAGKVEIHMDLVLHSTKQQQILA